MSTWRLGGAHLREGGRCRCRFGMGHIYYRQEKYGMAEYHFRRALGINPRSSVLRCYLGMALARLHRSADALEALSAAAEADPRNPLARFERAQVRSRRTAAWGAKRTKCAATA